MARPNRHVWSIEMGDGTWSVCCTGCRQPLFRGTETRAARAAARHRCPPRRLAGH